MSRGLAMEKRQGLAQAKTLTCLPGNGVMRLSKAGLASGACYAGRHGRSATMSTGVRLVEVHGQGIGSVFGNTHHGCENDSMQTGGAHGVGAPYHRGLAGATE